MAKANRKLTQQQKNFIQEYRKHGIASKAYKDAGYVCERDGKEELWIRQNAYHVLHRPAVQEELRRLEAKDAARDAYAIDYIREEHIRLMEKAEEKGDLTNATRNLEALGRTIGAYTDSVTVDVTAVREYTETERRELKKMAQYMLGHGIGVDSEEDVIDAKALPAPVSRGPGACDAGSQGNEVSAGGEKETPEKGTL